MEYHLHCDLAVVSDGLREYLQTEGFYVDNFLGSNDWGISFEPNQHFTRKFSQGSELRKATLSLRRWISGHPNKFVGYWEAEVVNRRIDFPLSKFDQLVTGPFYLNRLPTPAGYFKQKELHLSFLRDDSDVRLGRAMMAMGLYPVWWQDPDSGTVEEIWTIAGSAAAIDQIQSPLINYLKAAGGMRGGVLEIEAVSDWQVEPANFELPPLIGEVKFM